MIASSSSPTETGRKLGDTKAPAGRDRLVAAEHLKRIGRSLPVLALGLALAYLVLVPVAILAWSSVKPTGLPLDPGFTLQHFVSTYTNADTYRLLGTSVVFAVGSALLATTCGLILAWLVERTDLPGRNVFRALIVLPMAMPPVLLAISWVLLLSPRIGLINGMLRAVLGPDVPPLNVYSMGGMVFVQGLALVPTTFLVLSPSFRNMDPSLEEAALTSGAGTGFLLRRIVFPLLMPATLAAGFFALIVGMVVFDVPGILGLPAGIHVISMQVYFGMRPTAGLPDYGQVSALALSFVLLLVALGLLYGRLTSQAQRFVTVTGKGYRPRTFRLGRWKAAGVAFAWGYFLLAVAAPLATLLWTSLLPFYAGFSPELFDRVSLANHLTLLANPRLVDSARNSMVIAAVAASVVALLSALVAWVVLRSGARGRRIIDLMAFLPIAIPNVMLGLALIFVYLTVRVVPIYGTIWIIAIAHLTMYLSYGSRAAQTALMQLHKELEEAAFISGASWLLAFRRVVVPLMLPALIAIWVWVAAHSMRELSAALMLQGPNNPVIPTVLWDYWEGGQPTLAAAIGVWLIGALALLVAASQALSLRAGVGVGE